MKQINSNETNNIVNVNNILETSFCKQWHLQVDRYCAAAKYRSENKLYVQSKMNNQFSSRITLWLSRQSRGQKP